MSRAILRLASALALLVFLMGQALAADREGARQLLQSGLKSMKANDFLAAAADLEKSSALSPTPDSLLNLAICYRSLQRYGEVLDLLQRVRQEFGDKLKPSIKDACDRLEQEVQSLVATLVLSVTPSSAQVSVDGRISLTSAATESYLLAPGDHTLEASLAGFRTLVRTVHLAAGSATPEHLVLDPQPGALVIHSDPAGATVLIDGQERGTTPADAAIELAPGRHSLALRMVGRIPVEQTVDIRSGERQVLELTLLPLPSPVPPQALTSDATTPAKPSPPNRSWKIVGQVSAVGTILVGGTALVLWRGVAENHFRKMREYDRDYLTTGDPNDDHNRRAALHNAQRAGYAAIGCGIGAGILAAAAIAAFTEHAQTGDRREDKGKPTLSLSPMGLRLGF